MVLPLPGKAPSILPAGDAATVQVKVVPGVLPDRLIPIFPPEQIVCNEGAASTFGIGLTVTNTVMGSPGHPFAVGVTV